MFKVYENFETPFIEHTGTAISYLTFLEGSGLFSKKVIYLPPTKIEPCVEPLDIKIFEGCSN